MKKLLLIFMLVFVLTGCISFVERMRPDTTEEREWLLDIINDLEAPIHVDTEFIDMPDVFLGSSNLLVGSFGSDFFITKSFQDYYLYTSVHFMESTERNNVYIDALFIVYVDYTKDIYIELLFEPTESLKVPVTFRKFAENVHALSIHDFRKILYELGYEEVE